MSKKPSQSLVAELKPFVAPFRFDGSSEFHLKSQKTREMEVSTRARERRSSRPTTNG
jgi:hypothetical protein